MNFTLLLRSAFRSLHHHKMRSLLTTLGIIIGVVSIIAVMSIGEGAKYKVNKEIEKLGSNFIIVLATPPKTFTQQHGTTFFTLKPGDLQAIREECTDVKHISPGVTTSITAVFEGTSWQTFIFGINEEYFDIRDLKLTKGNFFTDQDVRAGNKVVVIGKQIVTELFKDTEPLGQTIRIKKLPFKVVGVLAEQGRTPDGRNLDDVLFMPVSTALRKLLGKTNYNAIVMSAANKGSMPGIARQVRSLLRQRHQLLEKDEDDFTLFTQDDAMKASEAAGTVLSLLLLIIASISLIVGGIGIMNIMLVTVSERTKEIGIRMALGATTASILTQFILEAIVICLIGGLVGVGLGIGISEFVGASLGWPIFISRKAIALSLGSAAFIGLFFGFYPAHKASRLNPVEALIEQ